MLSNHLILCWSLFLLFNLSQHQGLFQWIGSSTSGGPSIGASASVSALPMNIQGWFSLGLTGLIALLSKGLSRVFSSTINQISSSALSLLYGCKLSHPYRTTGKTTGLTIQTFVGKVTSLLYNMLSRLIITFLSKSKCLLISWLQSLQWFWSPRKENLSVLPLFPLLFSRKWWDLMPWS